MSDSMSDVCISIENYRQEALRGTTRRGNYCNRCGKEYGSEKNHGTCQCGGHIRTDMDAYEATPKPWW
jgi:hypothetical protein